MQPKGRAASLLASEVYTAQFRIAEFYTAESYGAGFCSRCWPGLWAGRVSRRRRKNGRRSRPENGRSRARKMRDRGRWDCCRWERTARCRWCRSRFWSAASSGTRRRTRLIRCRWRSSRARFMKPNERAVRWGCSPSTARYRAEPSTLRFRGLRRASGFQGEARRPRLS